MRLPKPIQRTVALLKELPSIGPRQAIRLAFFLISKGENAIRTLSRELDALGRVKVCERCFFIHENRDNLCDICRESHRNHGIIMIVEKETDLLSIENTGKFHGRYLILGMIPKTGLLEDFQKLRLQNLKKFIEKNFNNKAEEIILGFNPTSTGDFHASLLTKELAPYTKKISRLGRGLPTGGEIEFADDETLGSALERRE